MSIGGRGSGLGRMGFTGRHLAVAALVAAAFALGHEAGRPGPSEPAPASVTAAPRTTGPAAPAIAPDPAGPDSPPIDLGNAGDCGLGGACLDEEHLLIPLRG